MDYSAMKSFKNGKLVLKKLYVSCLDNNKKII